MLSLSKSKYASIILLDVSNDIGVGIALFNILTEPRVDLDKVIKLSRAYASLWHGLIKEILSPRGGISASKLIEALLWSFKTSKHFVIESHLRNRLISTLRIADAAYLASRGKLHSVAQHILYVLRNYLPNYIVVVTDRGSTEAECAQVIRDTLARALINVATVGMRDKYTPYLSLADYLARISAYLISKVWRGECNRRLDRVYRRLIKDLRGKVYEFLS